jgi:uncharacterized membrane protein
MTAMISRAALPLAALLALAGLGVATYLTTAHYAGQPIVCSGVGQCELVNSSKYAKLAGVPVALLGVVAYASMLGLIIVAWARGAQIALLAAWGIALASCAFSAYLTYIELFVIDAICAWCVASAVIMTLLFGALSAVAWKDVDAAPLPVAA